jgi:hypothetical protein
MPADFVLPRATVAQHHPLGREKITHMRCAHLREIADVARHNAALVPDNTQRLSKRLTVMYDACNTQLLAMCQHDRRNDGYTVPGLRERKQIGRSTALN